MLLQEAVRPGIRLDSLVPQSIQALVLLSANVAADRRAFLHRREEVAPQRGQVAVDKLAHVIGVINRLCVAHRSIQRHREALAQAEAEANRTKEESRRGIEAERESARAQLKGKVDQLSTTIINRLLAA